MGDPEPDIDSFGDSSARSTRKIRPWLAVAVWLPPDRLTADEAASTLFRFFRSTHVADLRVIFYLVFFLFLIHTFSELTFSKGNNSLWKVFMFWRFIHINADNIYTATITVYSAVLGWAYLFASKRLGVVDLFACEIRTLCRVGTAFDLGNLYIKMHDKGLIEHRPANSDGSQENYFPVFSNNSSDLEALEAMVVANITEFYTYMKAARDLQRKLATINLVPEAKKVLENLIYVLFLGYESGRNAVKDLVEFEPTRAENIMIILLTELVCYSFLCKHFKDPEEPGDELRYARLELRERDYKSDIPRLYRQVMSSHGKNEKDWKSAKGTAPELKKRYVEAFGEKMSDALKRIEREEAAKKSNSAAI